MSIWKYDRKQKIYKKKSTWLLSLRLYGSKRHRHLSNHSYLAGLPFLTSLSTSLSICVVFPDLSQPSKTMSAPRFKLFIFFWNNWYRCYLQFITLLEQYIHTNKWMLGISQIISKYQSKRLTSNWITIRTTIKLSIKNIFHSQKLHVFKNAESRYTFSLDYAQHYMAEKYSGQLSSPELGKMEAWDLLSFLDDRLDAASRKPGHSKMKTYTAKPRYAHIHRVDKRM